MGAGRYRWVICALLFFATTINYVDRQALGIVAPGLQNGPALFTPAMIADPIALADGLRSGDTAARRALRERLSPTTLDALSRPQKEIKPLESAIIADLNHVAQGPAIYDSAIFNNPGYSSHLQSQIAKFGKKPFKGKEVKGQGGHPLQ